MISLALRAHWRLSRAKAAIQNYGPKLVGRHRGAYVEMSPLCEVIGDQLEKNSIHVGKKNLSVVVKNPSMLEKKTMCSKVKELLRS